MQSKLAKKDFFEFKGKWFRRERNGWGIAIDVVPPPTPVPSFQRGDRVRKIKGSSWQGLVCGEYSTALTPEGYAVESEREPGSVQIYPASALEKVEAKP